MAHSVKCLWYKHKDSSVIPRGHIKNKNKKTNCVVWYPVLILSVLECRDRWVL